MEYTAVSFVVQSKRNVLVVSTCYEWHGICGYYCHYYCCDDDALLSLLLCAMVQRGNDDAMLWALKGVIGRDLSTRYQESALEWTAIEG